MKNYVVAIALLLSGGVYGVVLADHGLHPQTCKIKSVTVHQIGNYGLRLSCTDGRNMCGEGSDSWVFYDKNDANFKNYLSVALSALHTGSDVSIHEISSAPTKGPTRCIFTSIGISK